MYHNLIARNNFFRRNEDFLAVFFQPYLADIQRHAARQIADGFLVGPLLEKFSYAEQEHNRACGSVITTEHRNTDGRCIENRNFNLSFCKRPDSFPDIFYGNNCCVGIPYRRREEPLSSKVVNHFTDQFFLIFLVQLSAGAFHQPGRQFHLLVVKGLYHPKNGGAFSLIADHCITGSVIYLCKRYLFLVLQVVQQCFCLHGGHALLRQMNSDSASAFVFNIKFQILCLLEKHLQRILQAFCFFRMNTT